MDSDPYHFKRYGAGKYIVTVTAPIENKVLLERALDDACRIEAVYDRPRFVAHLVRAGLSEDQAETVADSISIDAATRDEP